MQGRPGCLLPGARALILLMLLAGCASPEPAASPGAALDEAAGQVSVQATATTGVIRGIVVDEAVRPLAGATVYLQDGPNATTNDAGTFGFDGLKPGAYFLTIDRAGYTQAKQSAQVLAGEAQPAVLRIQLKSIPAAAPYVEAYQTRLIVGFHACTDATGCLSIGGFVDNPAGIYGNGARYTLVLLNPNATVVQTEVRWEPTTPAAETGSVTCVASTTYDRADQQQRTGPSAVVVRLEATGVDEGKPVVADRAGCQWFPAPGSLPVGASYAQALDAYTHVFYNFRPRDDWQFGRDGDHPVPGG